MSTESLLSVISEETFLKSAYVSSSSVKGLIGFAKRVQNLLLTEPGTIPNCTQLGLGIKKYIMEFADGITEEVISNEVQRQIREFLPNDIIRSVKVKSVISGVNGKPVIAIYFNINKVMNVEQFVITLQNSSNYGSNINIVSSIYA